jgi:DNA-binding MarR family transcriptional regulator
VDLPERLHLIHQPQRLRLMALLVRHRDIAYTATRDALGLTDGNLASHAKRLEDAGFLQSRRALAGDRFEVRYRITPTGSQAFRDYLAALRAFLESEG